MSQTELNKMEKILKQKGLIRAEAEGEAAKLLKKLFDNVKNIRKPQQPSQWQDKKSWSPEDNQQFIMP